MAEYIDVKVGTETWRVVRGSIAEGMAHYAAKRASGDLPALTSDEWDGD